MLTDPKAQDLNAPSSRLEELESFKDGNGHYRFHLEVFENPHGTLSAFVQEFPHKFIHFETKTLAPAREIRRFIKELLEEKLPDIANVDVIPAGYEEVGVATEDQDDEDVLGIPACLQHAVRVKPELKDKIPKDPQLRLEQKNEKKQKLKAVAPKTPLSRFAPRPLRPL